MNDRQAATAIDLPQLVADNTTFALALYQHLKSAPGNLFFSPYSISTALAMTYAGARGETATQMVQALHFTLAPPQLHSAFQLLQTQVAATQKPDGVLLRVANASHRLALFFAPTTPSSF